MTFYNRHYNNKILLQLQTSVGILQVLAESVVYKSLLTLSQLTHTRFCVYIKRFVFVLFCMVSLLFTLKINHSMTQVSFFHFVINNNTLRIDNYKADAN